VGEVLAKRCGVITLPGGFFMPERDSPEWRMLEEQGSPLVDDKWIRYVHRLWGQRWMLMPWCPVDRFAVANVSDEVVKRVPGRLQRLNELAGDLGWTVKEN
jgi:hypothetical protein